MSAEIRQKHENFGGNTKAKKKTKLKKKREVSTFLTRRKIHVFGKEAIV